MEHVPGWAVGIEIDVTAFDSNSATILDVFIFTTNSTGELRPKFADPQHPWLLKFTVQKVYPIPQVMLTPEYAFGFIVSLLFDDGQSDPQDYGTGTLMVRTADPSNFIFIKGSYHTVSKTANSYGEGTLIGGPLPKI